MANKPIRERLDELPADLEREVLDFIEFLIERRTQKKTAGRLTFNWEGGLSELRDKFTSVELQHKASEWR